MAFARGIGVCARPRWRRQHEPHLRVQTAERSFILKQSRPWVEKYPAIPAPEERVLVEAAFYEPLSAARWWPSACPASWAGMRRILLPRLKTWGDCGLYRFVQ